MGVEFTPARTKPKTDDRLIWDLIFSFSATPVLSI
jgi:hypothetical protein